MNGYNFTERVRKVLAMAREEAARLHHEYVGTEHILLGLIREGEGVAAAVLYLLLPYTALMTGRVDHALPGALVIWAIQRNYARQQKWPTAQGRIERSGVHEFQELEQRDEKGEPFTLATYQRRVP